MSETKSSDFISGENLHRHRVDKNQLLLASIFNVISFFSAIFSMAYYEWVQITFSSPRSPNGLITIWSNLLYSYHQGEYVSYETLRQEICNSGDSACLAILYELDFVGKLCFGILAFAFLISSYDFVKIIKFAMGEITTKSKFFIESASASYFKNNFRSILMITTYGVGLSLDYFAIQVMNLESYVYGVSFWLFFSSLILFLIVSIWQNRRMSRLSRQQLVIKLLQREKALMRESKTSKSSFSNKSSETLTI